MKKLSKQRFFSTVTVLWILFVSAAMFSTTASAADTWKIGILTCTLPGGPGIRMAAQLAAEDINAQGGILGKQIELVYGDARDKPMIGSYEYTRLADKEKVIAVIGTGSSEVALEIMKQVPQYKVPFFAIGASTPKIAEEVRLNYEKYKYVFKVFHDSYELGNFTTDWLIHQMIKPRQIRKAAMVIESAAWTRPLSEEWKKQMETVGAEIPVFEYFDTHTKDFLPIVQKVRESEAEAIITAFAHTDPADFVKLWADNKGPLMAGIIGLFPTLKKTAGEKTFSVISMAYPGIIGLTPRDKLFCEKYNGKFQAAPEYTSPYTYDAMQILKIAVEKAGTAEAEILVKTLEETDYQGIMGRWVFDRKSHHSKFGPGYRQFMMVQWQPPGHLCVIWPEEMKNCEMILPPWQEKNGNPEQGRQSR
ncbi:MAG: ABC transporter substrate-binding protein [Desulfobacterales bacterium]